MMYDFECPRCGYLVEVSVKVNDIATYRIECPMCKHKMKRIYTVPYVHYKGAGFYTTDYKKKQDKKE